MACLPVFTNSTPLACREPTAVLPLLYRMSPTNTCMPYTSDGLVSAPCTTMLCDTTPTAAASVIVLPLPSATAPAKWRCWSFVAKVTVCLSALTAATVKFSVCVASYSVEVITMLSPATQSTACDSCSTLSPACAVAASLVHGTTRALPHRFTCPNTASSLLPRNSELDTITVGSDRMPAMMICARCVNGCACSPTSR